MRILDAQVHAYERDHAGRPWLHPHLPGPLEVNGEQMAAAMDQAGVDGAILVSAVSMYGYDPSYAVSVYSKYPEKFRLIKPVDITAPDVAESIAEWAATEGAVGVRILLMGDATTDPADPGLNRALAAAARHALPVNIQCWGRLDQFRALATSNPNTMLLIDHLGLAQPMAPPSSPGCFDELPKLLELASYDNVAVKVTGACTLSRQPYPFEDLWDPLCRLFDAFGFNRCLWGSDWTRTASFLTYDQAVAAFKETRRLSDSDRDRLMGGTLARIYDWLA